MARAVMVPRDGVRRRLLTTLMVLGAAAFITAAAEDGYAADGASTPRVSRGGSSAKGPKWGGPHGGTGLPLVERPAEILKGKHVNFPQRVSETRLISLTGQHV